MNGINKDLINEWMNHFSSSLANEKLAGCREQIYTIKQMGSERNMKN